MPKNGVKIYAKGDASAYPASVDAFEIKKGERIYFRVQSGAKEQSNGAFDKVAWSPVITYAGTAEPCREAILRRFTNLRKVRYMT